MKCGRIQELILSDYTDDRLDEAISRQIANHIEQCASCREYDRILRDKVIQPLRNAKQTQAPSYIWEGVKHRLAAERRVGVLSHVLEVVRRATAPISRIPRPAMAFALVAMLFIAVLVAHSHFAAAGMNEYLTDQIDFMAGLDSADANGFDMPDTHVATSVENLL